MKIKIKANLAGGVIFLLFSIIAWMLIPSQIQASKIATTLIGARFVPQITIIVIFVLSLAMLLLSLILKKDKIIDIDLSKEVKVFIFYAMLVGYVLLIPILGFLVSSLLFCIAMLLYFKVKKWTYYVISISVIVLLNFIFSNVLSVPLP